MSDIVTAENFKERPGPRKQVSTTVDDALYTQLTDLRFALRHDKLTDTVREAIREYVAKYGIVETAKAR